MDAEDLDLNPVEQVRLILNGCDIREIEHILGNTIDFYGDELRTTKHNLEDGDSEFITYGLKIMRAAELEQTMWNIVRINQVNENDKRRRNGGAK